MKNTRFMEVLFSAVENNDEELANQVAQDIEAAKADGVVDTDEVKYESDGSGKVTITDKETGEVTVAEKAADEDGAYDLYPAQPDEQIEGFLHPEGDGVTPGNQVGAPDEEVEDHMDGNGVISPNLECGGLNPQAGVEPSVECLAQAGPGEEEEREFSVTSDNSVVLRIFSDQEFCERLFSEVIESEDTAIVGDLKVEKDPDEENTVIVTSESTGDQAKVALDGPEMEVTELESKNFSDEEQYEPLFVVGVDPVNHVIVDAPEYTPESAQELVQRLSEQGVDAVQVFETPEEARDYAIDLLNGLGVQHEDDIESPEQVEFSDHTVYLTKFYSDNTNFMCRLFSEAVNEIDASQDTIEDAISNGDEIETDTEIITPIDSKTAVVEDKDNGEFTKVVLDGTEMDLALISEKEAEDLTSHLAVEDTDEDEEEKDFSDIYCDEAETKFFSINEEMTEYMVRLFSEESSQSEIEKAIENGEQIENDTEIITPIDATTAIVEDKENGEFTKAELEDDSIEVKPISENEADKLTEGLAVEDNNEDEDEKQFSEIEKYFSESEGEIYCDESATKFFSEHEEVTEYMVRLFSEEADSEDIEKAIESGEVLETEKEVITPISDTEAVVEDKENGEFTKAVVDDSNVEVHPLTEEEADKLEKEAEDKEEEKKFSNLSTLDKFFSEALPTTGGQGVPAIVNPETGEIISMEAPVQEEVVGVAQPEVPTVEAIEDKALAAVQSIRAVAEEAASAIMDAKAAPAEVAEPDLKEAQFSNKNDNQDGGLLVSWLKQNGINK